MAARRGFFQNPKQRARERILGYLTEARHQAEEARKEREAGQFYGSWKRLEDAIDALLEAADEIVRVM